MSEIVLKNPRRSLPPAASTAERRAMTRLARLLRDEFQWTLPGSAFSCTRDGDWIRLRIGNRDVSFNLRGQLGGSGTSFVSRGLVLSKRPVHRGARRGCRA